MKTNINQNTPYRDKFRESLFKDAFNLDAEIQTANTIDSNNNWVRCLLKFKHKNSVYCLDEIFKLGDDNSTDYVILLKDNEEIERFDRFYDAELKMVDLMRSN